MSHLVVGIDPGLTGGLAWLASERPDNPQARRMPALPKGAGIDFAAVVEWLEWCAAWPGGDVRVVIEQASTRPKQSAQSGLTTGTNYGRLLGILDVLRVPVEVVRPQVWQSAIGVPACRMPLLDKRGNQLTTKRGRPRTTTDRVAKKAAIIAMVKKRWPSVNLAPGRCTTPQDGMADALAIAWYGVVRAAGGEE